MERFYTWRIVTYVPKEEFIQVLDEKCKHWIGIHHDKDENEPHWHYVVTFEAKKSKAKVLSYFERFEQNTFAIPSYDIQESVEYLLHANEENSDEA